MEVGGWSLLLHIFQSQITSSGGKLRAWLWYSVSSIICPQRWGDGKRARLGSRVAERPLDSAISPAAQGKVLGLRDAASSWAGG